MRTLDDRDILQYAGEAARCADVNIQYKRLEL